MEDAPLPQQQPQPTPAPEQAASGPPSPAPVSPEPLSPEPPSPSTQGTGQRRLERIFSLSLLLLGAALLAPTFRPPAVELRWESGSEQDVAAFNLYRQALAEQSGTPQAAAGAGQADATAGNTDADAGQASSTVGDADAESLVNPAPIPARGNAAEGARYSFRDRGVLWGGHYRYRIEELDMQGRSRFLAQTITVEVRDQRPWQWGLGLLTLAWALVTWRRAND